MSSGKEIESPQTLASLPKPIDTVNGRIQAAPVHSLNGSRKRKRTEICSCIDGEGINIYNIQAPRLVTSYPLPPHTYFTSQPCSVYRRFSKQEPAKRFTYASVAESESGVKPRILCFAEDVKHSATGSPEKSSYDLSPFAGGVIAIKVVPSSTAVTAARDGQDIVVVHESGEVECLSADLKAQRWSVSLGSVARSRGGTRSKRMVQVEYAALTDAGTARKGLLKSREDISASLDPAGDTQSDVVRATQLLCLVSRPLEQAMLQEQGRSVHILAIRPRSTDVITSHRPPLHHLLEWRLPITSVEDARPMFRPEYSIHASSGTLYQSLEGTIVTYDLSGTIPRVISELSLTGHTFQSFVRLSSSTVMITSSELCAIFDVKFNAVQALLPLSPNIQHGPEDKKRKQSALQPQHSSLQLLSYFAELGLVVGLAANELVGLQLNASQARPKRSRTGENSLIDSISKGVGAKHSNTKEPSESEWLKLVPQLDELAAQKNIDEFERLFFQAISVKRRARHNKPKSSHNHTEAEAPPKNGYINGVTEPRMANGVSEHSEQETGDHMQLELRRNPAEDSSIDWRIPKDLTDSRRQSQRPKALYALSKIFAWTLSVSGVTASGKSATEQSSVFIQFFPPNVVRWLMSMGYLTTSSIELALRNHSLFKDRLRDVTVGSLVSAIVEFDPDMRLLHNIMNQSSFLEISEVVQAIKILVQSLDNIPLPQISQHLLTNDPASLPNSDLDSHFDSEAEAASQDLSYALSTLEDGLSIRSQTLRQALTKLHSFPPQRVTRTLRTALTQHELIFLIQILRIELADGGWTSRYIDAGPAHLDGLVGDPSDRAITIIANLISCALDAIGTGGWLVAGAVNPADGADDLLLSLRAEISAALEGIHEASFMKGLLNDFLRFGVVKRKTQRLGKADRKGRKKPVTVQLQAEDDRVLPLGFKVEGRIEGTKVKAGGEVKEKSKREIGQEISKRVGKYSFERIRI